MNSKREFEILNGGAEIEVTLNDGRTEKVKVLDIPVRRRAEIGEAIGRGETEEVQLYTGRKLDWIDSLTPESFDKIIEEGHRLNLTKGTAWLKARARINIAADPTGRLAEVVEKANQQMTAALASASPPPSST